MSSSTPSRPERGAVRLAAPVLVVLALLSLAVPVAAAPTAVPLPGATVLPVTEGQVCLVVDASGGTQPLPADAVSVTVAGTKQRASVAPVMSDDLAVALVVDASQAGGAQLASWLSGAARFVLDAPHATRTAVVADTTPPVVLARSQEGPVDLVQALSGVKPHGARDTSQALSVALGELPDTPAEAPRVVILYTSGSDAGSEASGALAGRLAREHVLLVVVSTAGDTRYWSAATRPTGGFLAPAGAAAVPAFDQVSTALRNRYLINFPAPAHLPARASVRIDLPTLAMATDVDIPAPDVAPAAGSGGPSWQTVALWAAAVGAVVLLLIGTALRLR